MHEWFVKARRAQSDSDDESWQRGGVSPTLNAFDNGGESRATVLIYSISSGTPRPDRPEGGLYVSEVDVSRTLDTTNGLSPEKNDGGMAVVAFSHTQGIDPQASSDATPTLRREGGGHGCNE